MHLGTVIRWLLVLVWLGFFGSHALRYALPDLGLTERRDFAAVLNANLDHDLVYELRPDRRDGRGRPLGTCRLSFARSENSYLLTTTLELSNLNAIPGLDLLRHALPRRDPQFNLHLIETLDERMRLVGIEVSGRALGTAVTATGTVDGQGLHGQYRIDDGPPTDFAVPGLNQELNQGMDLAMSLPPGLKPGEKFTTRLFTLDWMKLAPKEKLAVFAVHEREAIATAAGTLNLLRVEMEVDVRPFATLWCDEHGLVMRSRQANSGMALVLTSVRGAEGEVLWPPPKAGAPTPTPAATDARPMP
jgi:hypothetical protein